VGAGSSEKGFWEKQGVPPTEREGSSRGKKEKRFTRSLWARRKDPKKKRKEGTGPARGKKKGGERSEGAEANER